MQFLYKHVLVMRWGSRRFSITYNSLEMILLLFGFAFRGGCEVANLGVRLLLESSPSWGVIQVDVKNAFNTIHRRPIFEELRDVGGVLGG